MGGAPVGAFAVHLGVLLADDRRVFADQPLRLPDREAAIANAFINVRFSCSKGSEPPPAPRNTNLALSILFFASFLSCTATRQWPALASFFKEVDP